MARKSRIDALRALHHIIIRDIERRPIFIDTADYRNCLERLGDMLADSSTPCYAWALMTNHAHFLLRTGTALRSYSGCGHAVLMGRRDHTWQDATYIMEIMSIFHHRPPITCII